MSEQINNGISFPDQLSDILLVLDRERRRIEAVTGVDKDGKLKTAEALKKNQGQFMRVDKQGDIFSNFFSNFFSQLKNPLRFGFFKVPADKAVEVAKQLQQEVNSTTAEGQKLMKDYEVTAGPQKEVKHENQSNMGTQQNNQEEFRFQADELDWKTLEGFGFGKDRLTELNHLEPLLKGYKTDSLVSGDANFGTAIMRFEARLQLFRDENQKAVMGIHCVRKSPNLSLPFLGHVFTPEDKERLLQTGNLGRIIELTNRKTGEKFKAAVSLDRLTNEVVAYRAEKIKVPDEIKGVKVSDEQRQTILDGKPALIEGMTDRHGNKFDAYVQFNADKCYTEFLFGERAPNYEQQTVSPGEAPRVVRGKALDEVQYEKLNKGETIYVSDIPKRAGGGTYSGYFTYDKQTGKTDFSFGNPENFKGQIVPRETRNTKSAADPAKTNSRGAEPKQPKKTATKADTPAKSRTRKV